MKADKVLHDEAKATPERPFCIIPKSDDVEDGFRSITFEQVARAVNHLSRWLLDRFGRQDQTSKHLTLAYIGVSDPCYAIVIYATIQCRWKIFLPSPRNTAAVNASLLEQTKCQGLIYAEQLGPVAKTIQQQSTSLHTVPLPSLEELLRAPECNLIQQPSYNEIYEEPIVIFHSSGSTGLPRPITYTHGALATFDIRNFPTVSGRENNDSLGSLRYEEAGGRIFDIFPPYHLAGFTTKVVVPLYNLTVPIFGPSTRPPSGALTATIIRNLRPRCVVLPPAIIEMIYHEPDGQEIFKHLETVLYAGGPLADAIGDQISRYTKVCQSYGSTEIGQVRQLFPKREDWAYLEFHPNEHFEFREDVDGLSELVIFSGPEVASTSVLYHTFPDVKEYQTKDLFEPHPNKPGLWKFKARKDDILVFSSGEKLNPLPLEILMTTISGVKGALVAGQGRPRSALLIELAPDVRFSNALEELWPYIEQGNSQLPAHGRVSKNMVIFADENKPFARAGKGTVIRRMTEKLYEQEIQRLFSSITVKSERVVMNLSPSTFHINDVKKFLHTVLNQVSIDSNFGDDDSFYMYGMDSVKTVETLNHLKASLSAIKPDADLDWLTVETIYVHPTVELLSSILLDFLNEGKLPEKHDHVAEMKKKIATYTDGLPTLLQQPRVNPSRNSFAIAITGTTGYFGSQMLIELSKVPLISRIYCLNRSSKSNSIMKSNGFHKTDTVSIQVNLTSPNLGMHEDEYALLVNDCDLIIHNAWQVDFNLPLAHFDVHLGAVRGLIDLCTKSKVGMKLVFISSIGATGVWGSESDTQRTVPESIVEDLRSAMHTGYGDSKRVAEHVLDAGSQNSGAPVTIVRLGELVPSKDGVWADRDLAAAFLKTCKASGQLPHDFTDMIDWIPVDWAATILCDLVVHELKHDGAHETQVLNLVNPNPCSWSVLMDTILSWCGEGTKIVSMMEWVEHLQNMRTGDVAELSQLPALRMIPFYEKMARKGPMHRYAMQNWQSIVPASRMSSTKVDEQMLTQWLGKL